MARTSTIVMLVGVVMLFLPEPITSGLGLLVILAGLAMRLLSSV
ncbi:transporter [Haladaptatus sp. DFWS20]